MSFHVVIWFQLISIVIFAGPQSPQHENEETPSMTKNESDLTNGVLDSLTERMINSSVLSSLSLSTVIPTTRLTATGRYAIDRIIMEGDNVPLLSQNGPYFDTSSHSNMTAVTGDTAILKCRVHNLGNKTVSWIRLSDLNLLTVGRYTYTSDLRFEAKHEKHTMDWNLVLREARLTDTGIYECQVSTTPHISQLTYLEVRDPDSLLLGGPEMFVESSSMINLTCVISWTSSPPDQIMWYHNQTKLTFRGPRPGVSLIVDKSEVTTVSLLLQMARLKDSGLYECKPDNAPVANITLHVLKGDKTAELSRSTGLIRDGSEFISLILTLSVINVNIKFWELKQIYQQ